MIGKGKTLLVHDDCVVSRVAHRLEELCGEIKLCQSILKNAPDLPTEYRRANKEQVRQRLELARWNLDDLLEDIEDGKLDTAKVKAFRAPAGTLVEVYATTLHYAPCHVDADKGFRVLVALPKGTNTAKPDMQNNGGDDPLLWACNKWLLAHAESAEAKAGAYVGLVGENIHI